MIVRDVMSSGISPFTARHIAGSNVTAIAAAGTTQANATVLSATYNDVATCPSNAGVSLPIQALSPGDRIAVYNGGANTLKVYPLSGESIGNGATNAAFSVATTKMAEFVRINGTTWRPLLSA